MTEHGLLHVLTRSLAGTAQNTRVSHGTETKLDRVTSDLKAPYVQASMHAGGQACVLAWLGSSGVLRARHCRGAKFSAAWVVGVARNDEYATW